MPTPYVASVDGEWDASVTNTWGQGIGVYPNTAGDVWTVGAGRTVTYNKVSTVELGAGSITGLLTFDPTMSTKLTMSHNDITVNNGGELRVGASGAEIPAAYKAELIWNTTADNAKGISLAAGGKLTVYGDPDYFGSDYDTVLTSDNVIAIAGLSRAAACVVTWTTHGLITGDVVTFSGITQDGAGQWPTLNATWAITKINADTFSIPVNTSGYTNAYVPATDPGIQQAVAIPAATNPITITVAGDFTSDGNAEAISAMTRAADCSITWALHGLTAGDKFTIAGIAQADWTALNGVQTVKAVTDANTITIEADTSGFADAYSDTDPGTYTRPKWKVGQELIMHKGGAYSSYINDFCRLAITSITANAGNTDIATTVTERPAALTCLVGADVVNVARNVLLYKLGYDANINQQNSLRPRFLNNNFSMGVTNVNIYDASFAGFYAAGSGYYNYYERVVTRNGLYLAYAVNLVSSGYFHVVTFSCGMSNNLWSSLIYGKLMALSSSTGIGGINNSIYSSSYGYRYYAISGVGNVLYGNIYSCGGGIANCKDIIIYGGLGYDAAGVQKANAIDFDFFFNATSVGVSCRNALTSVPPIFGNRNAQPSQGRVTFEHYGRVAGAHYVVTAFGDITKTAADGTGDNPTQRSGGNADVIEAVPQSNCAAVSYLELLNIRLWAAAGVSKTYRFYVQTDFATLPTAELKLYGEYLDEVSGGHLATVSSTQDITTRATAADWSQYVEVTMNPAQTGYVNLYMRLMGYEAAKKVWVDPMGVIT